MPTKLVRQFKLRGACRLGNGVEISPTGCILHSITALGEEDGCLSFCIRKSWSNHLFIDAHGLLSKRRKNGFPDTLPRTVRRLAIAGLQASMLVKKITEIKVADFVGSQTTLSSHHDHRVVTRCWKLFLLARNIHGTHKLVKRDQSFASEDKILVFVIKHM